VNVQPQVGGATRRYGMVVDVNRCVGCQTCTISCKHANDTPPGVQWRQVLDVEQGKFPDVERFFLVVGCQHCAEPPCVPVCPTGATAQREDGLVTMDYDLCIGCAYCAVSCPYQARTIAHEKRSYYGDRETVQEAHVAHDERLGVVQKCTFCIDRVDEAEERGLTAGVDWEVTPACAASCIAQAIQFGDFNDPQSNVSTLARERKSFQINDFLKTDPQIKYLYEVPGAIPGRDAVAADDDTLRDPANPLAGKLQRFWDFRAAMNFMMGGFGSGFLVVTMVAALFGLVSEVPVRALSTLAALVIITGLFFVFLEIGRKLRFLNALLRPQSSWMTREIYVVAVLFPLLALTFVYQSGLVYLAIALSAFAFLYCQARIIHAAKGIPAWRAPLLPWLIVATGLMEGTGGYLVMHGALWSFGVEATWAVPLAGLVLAGAVAGLMTVYVSRARDEHIPPLAVDVLAGVRKVVWAGCGLAAVLLLASLFGAGLGVVAGLVMIATGLYWKFMLVTRASYQQGFVLPKIPQRGSGARAASPRLDGFSSRPPEAAAPVSEPA